MPPARSVPALVEAVTCTALWLTACSAAGPSGGLTPVVDVTDVQVQVSDDAVTAVLHLADVPDELAVDREGVEAGSVEYSWQVCVDVDRDAATGEAAWFGNMEVPGLDYCLEAAHVKRETAEATSMPIAAGLHVNVWKLEGGIGGEWISSGRLDVDPEAETIRMAGMIPGATRASKFYFYTYDDNPGGQPLSDFGTVTEGISIQ